MNSAEPVKVWAGARVAVLSPTPTHPQDFGNRKRVFRICSRYAQEGARITFIHYPAELEWREQIPFRAERAMSQAWPQYFTIPPTRLLHVDPAGNYHSIDEWWDVAIGQFLTWLFSVQSFDIFIVNYSWLSKALEFAPPSTFKILDTHDKFSGRREMLESLGLHPEFFYTTEAQEKIALGRADLVWAIKREEAAQLQELSEIAGAGAAASRSVPRIAQARARRARVSESRRHRRAQQRQPYEHRRVPGRGRADLPRRLRAGKGGDRGLGLRPSQGRREP